jgi:tRNA pseudouridine55 synthase
MDGLLIIDKPPGCTSHDVVLRVRRILGTKRVGHGGTLDPDATGVLLVALGQATRFFPFLSGHDKTYEGRIRLGHATDTYDAAGRPTTEEWTDGFPREAAVAAAVKSFEGEILQLPPPYSAKKLGGKPAYKLARAGRDFVLEPVRITVRLFKLKNYAPPFLDFEAACSAGTYIRSLAHDLGLKLGCGGHLLSLRRTRSGPYAVDAAILLSEVEKAASEGRAGQLVIPLERLLPGAPAVVLSPEAGPRVANGSPLLRGHMSDISADPFVRSDEAPVFKVFDSRGKLLALARPSAEGEALLPFLVLR